MAHPATNTETSKRPTAEVVDFLKAAEAMHRRNADEWEDGGYDNPRVGQLLSDYPMFEVLGDISDEFLDHEVQWARGDGAAAKSFALRKGPLIDFLRKEMQPFDIRADKDGRCFVPAKLGAGGLRANTNVLLNPMIGIDVDNGTSRASIITSIVDQNFAAIVYPTYSDQLPETAIPNDQFVSWATANGHDSIATIETARLYLSSVKGYLPEVVVTIDHVELQRNLTFRVRHAPFDKTRVVLFPDRPYDYFELVKARVFKTRKEAGDFWGEIVGESASMFGAIADKQARDPARLFYAPSMPHGAGDRRVTLIGGQSVKLDDIMAAVRCRLEAEAEARARTKSAGKRTTDWQQTSANKFGAPEPSSADKHWIKERGKDFDIVKLFETHAPDKILAQEYDGKVEVLCPFDGAHSNGSQGCFVKSGTGDLAFVFSCQHTCKSVAKLEMLCAAVEAGYFGDVDFKTAEFDRLGRDWTGAPTGRRNHDDDDAGPVSLWNRAERTSLDAEGWIQFSPGSEHMVKEFEGTRWIYKKTDGPGTRLCQHFRVSRVAADAVGRQQHMTITFPSSEGETMSVTFPRSDLHKYALLGNHLLDAGFRCTAVANVGAILMPVSFAANALVVERTGFTSDGTAVLRPDGQTVRHAGRV
jgi:hypothetical protein